MGYITRNIEYNYKNCPIPGGGYVTGFLFHPRFENILYARTDIGGVYRFDYANECWISLVEHVKTTMVDETYPIAIAVDEENENSLYIACGDDRVPNGLFCISHDKGDTFTYESLPFPVHGNWPGRGSGYRLVKDKSRKDTLYFASQKSGLFRTTDEGKSWKRLDIKENYMTFVHVSDDGNMVLVGTAGVTTAKDKYTRGHSLYISYDGGETFEELNEPKSLCIGQAKMNGLVASRCNTDGKYIYITMNSTGPHNYIVDMGYSCDTGSLIDGRVIRYEICDGRLGEYVDITPVEPEKLYKKDDNGENYLRFGFGSCSPALNKPGMVILSSLCRDSVDDDCVYRSFDYGKTWEKILQGLHTGNIVFNSVYMRPEYNGERSLIHWLTDLRVSPHNDNEAWFNTGSGVFRSMNVTEDVVSFQDINVGIEETVHLNVYAPVSGETKVVDIVGDLGGFAFRDLDTPCDNSFADSDGNRYITCINADISDTNSDIGIITARGNWRGLTKGGLITTNDNFKTFERIPMCYGLSPEIDMRMHEIERPNVNPGWVAMSGDGRNIVWSIADGITLPMEYVISSQNYGKRFDIVKIYDINRRLVSGGLFKTFSDRKKTNVFFGFDDASHFYVSTDGGASFYEKEVVGYIPAIEFGLIDTINKTEVRAEGGRSGVFYMSLRDNGLWKLVYDYNTEIFKLNKLTKDGDKVFRMGLGLSREGGDYLKEPKAIYVCAQLDGEYGFFRTFDEGNSFERISNDKQNFGDINSIDGDKRVFGRFFIATGTRGLKYGEMV